MNARHDARNRAPALTFYGAAGTVTGSKFLIDSAGGRLMVDCGLYQGEKRWRERNWEEFPIPPDSIDAVALTHAWVFTPPTIKWVQRALSSTGPSCVPKNAL